MRKNIEQDPLLWYPQAYDRACSAITNSSNEQSNEEWIAYNWDRPEVGTFKPKARAGHGTLFLLWDGTTKPFDIPAVVQVAKDLKLSLVGNDGDLGSSSSNDSAYSLPDEFGSMAALSRQARKNPPGFFFYLDRQGPSRYQKRHLPQEMERLRVKTFMGPKTMDINPAADVFCDAKNDDPWYGPLLVAQSRTPVGLDALRRIASNTPAGKAVLIEHVQKSIELDSDKGLVLRIVTGLGDDSIPFEDGKDLLFGDFSGGANHKRALATRFHLFREGSEVARCHVSYRDGSHNSAIGPTIEMIETAKSRRGNGYLRMLYEQVEKHFFDIWRVRRMPNKFADGNKFGPAPQPGFIMKATYLTETIVERKKKKEGDGAAINDKRFFTECGFQVRDVCEGLSPIEREVISRRPADEEMMKFVVIADLPKRTKDTEQTRFCESCKKHGTPELFKRCSRCMCAQYCCRDCQAEDWPYHKLWCNKSADRVLEKLIDLKLFHRVTLAGQTQLVDDTSKFIAGEASAEDCARIYDAVGVKTGDPRRPPGI